MHDYSCEVLFEGIQNYVEFLLLSEKENVGAFYEEEWQAGFIFIN